MTRRSIRIRLALALLCLCALPALFWAALGFSLPTPELAFGRMARQHMAGDAPIVAQGELSVADDSYYTAHQARWLVARQGGRFLCAGVQKTFWFLWKPSQDTFSRFQATPVLDRERPLYLWTVHTGADFDQEHRNYLSVACCGDPDVVRVELTRAQLPHTGGGGLDQYGVTVSAAETSPGSGVFEFRHTVPNQPGQNGGYLSYRLRGYDAQGALVYELVV